MTFRSKRHPALFKSGNTHGMKNRKYPTLYDRLLANTEILPWSGCWVWLGSVNHRGYGVCVVYRGMKAIGKVLGVAKRKPFRYPVYIHRTMYQIAFNKELAPDIVLRHTCNIRACWNPDHLLEGSQLQNIQDQYRAGTNVNQTGRNHNTAWLTKRILENGY